MSAHNLPGPFPPDYPQDLEDLFVEIDPEEIPYLEDALDEIIDSLTDNSQGGEDEQDR